MFRSPDVIVAVVFLGAVTLAMFLRKRRSISRPFLLTPAERRFYRTLAAAVDASNGKLDILPQVRLAELVEPVPDEPSLRRQRMAAIACKTIDFVVCVRENNEYRPLVCVELNDASHRRHDRIERDAVVHMACVSACLPIAFIDIRHISDRNEVRRRIRQAVDRCVADHGRGYVVRRLPMVAPEIIADARKRNLRVCPFVRRVDAVANPPRPKTNRWYDMARTSVVALCDRHWRVVDVR